MKKNLLFIIDNLKGGGAERILIINPISQK